MRYDFSYSTEVFLRLIEDEVAKGSMSFCDMGELGERISALYGKLKEANCGETVLDYWQKKEINDNIEELKLQLVACIVDSIQRNELEVNLKESFAKGKEVIVTGDYKTALLSKKIKDDILNIYKCYPSDRNDILVKLHSVLKENVAYSVIRTDIHHFFETISQDAILLKLSADRLLSPLSEKYLRRFFYEYDKLICSGKTVGLPRGIAFSSCLAELFMRPIDKKIQELPGVYYYARYVDDIILVCLNNRQISDAKQYIDAIETICLEAELTLNKEKTQSIDIWKKNKTKSFDYLGYTFCLRGNTIYIRLPEYKMERYKYQIDQLISHYNRISLFHTKGKKSPLRELIGYMEALTSNSRMVGRKCFVKTGIYYSHSLMTDLSQWKELDEYLSYSISHNLQIPDHPFIINGSGKDKNAEKIRSIILRKCSFKEGYSKKRIYHGTPQEYAESLKLLRLIANG